MTSVSPRRKKSKPAGFSFQDLSKFLMFKTIYNFLSDLEQSDPTQECPDPKDTYPKKAGKILMDRIIHSYCLD